MGFATDPYIVKPNLGSDVSPILCPCSASFWWEPQIFTTFQEGLNNHHDSLRVHGLCFCVVKSLLLVPAKFEVAHLQNLETHLPSWQSSQSGGKGSALFA